MKTLLEKVKIIEQQAQEIIRNAELSGKKSLESVQRGGEDVINDVREKAQKKAEEIIGENIHSAQQEVNSLKQERTQSVDMVHEAAQKNRDATLKLVSKLFKDEYLASKSRE